MDGQMMDGWLGRCVYTWMDGWMDEQMMDGWLGRCVYIWMDGWMDITVWSTHTVENHPA